MDYIKIRFSNDVDRVGSTFEKALADVFQSANPMFALSKSTWKPQIDMLETSDEIIVIAEIAGVDKTDLDLEINTRAIRISGKRVLSPPAKNGRYRVAEIQYGGFDRLLRLPSPIDTEKVTAAYQKGMLTIQAPKIQYETRYNIPISGE